MTTLFGVWDHTAWSVEPPDESVGIFGFAWCHETCPREYDQGVEMTEHMHGEANEKGYVANTVHLHCLDCDATTQFESDVFVGFPEEEMLAAWERGEA
jgi:hypothetical protein